MVHLAHRQQKRSISKSTPKRDHRSIQAGLELNEESAYGELGFSFPWYKKWTILTVIFVVQCSMNFNSSVYTSSIEIMASQPPQGFGVSKQTIRVGQCIFLVTYALGSELWAPWSEEVGRWPVLQLSLFLVNIWQVLCALAPNHSCLIIGRALGGLSSAGGSVTLGMVADMFEPQNQQFAVAYVVLASVAGSVLGPIFGGFIGEYLSWRWNFWVQLIFGVFTQILHFLCVPETRVTIILDREAKKRRNAGENVFGPNEVKGSLLKRMTLKELTIIWTRPFHMLITEPIVLCLSLLSGFSDGLIFTFLEAYNPVFKQWHFSPVALGLAYIPIMIGYILAWLSFMPFFKRDQKFMTQHGPDAMEPERRLYWLLYTAPLEAIGLFGFAWTSLGPSHGIPWIAPMLFSALVGIANYAIYMATIDYMVAAYGPYAASATGGNDLFAGIAAMYSAPFYSYFSRHTLEWPSTILGFIAVVVTIPIYIFYWKGPQIRRHSKFAQDVLKKRQDKEGRRASRLSSSQPPANKETATQEKHELNV
ncbi:putative MFS transporter [Myriangium duriaei CBS 260.36]|uniref:MFS transporter n=1 Tax=Myriangium duriaei CBS 260.36 TaxID=1168546 RepID=A0A9P4IU63_9PEZI|nr:putative MFS transporter [Myriangium duriaei CBS 260.36]